MDSTAIERINENIRTHSPVLDLSNCDFSKEFYTIEKLTWLEELDLSASDLSPKTLYRNSGALDFEYLEKLKKLKKLNLSGQRLGNVYLLPELPQLEELDLNNNNFTDLDSLPELPALHTLKMSNNDVYDLNGIERINHLKYLDLSSNAFNDIELAEGLINLVSLIHLDVSSNNLLQLDNFPLLPHLEILDISNCTILTLDSVPQLPKLHTLIVRNHSLYSTYGLSKLIHLQNLDLSISDLTDYLPEEEFDLNDIDNLLLLRKLDLSGLHLKSIINLPLLPDLEILDISRNSLTDLNLPELSKLHTLSARENLVTDVSGLKNLRSLEQLDLSNSLPRHISLGVFRHLKRLKILDLSENHLSSLDTLPSLPALETLILNKAGLNTLSDLPKLYQLRTLNARMNEITDISGLQKLINLEELDISEWNGPIFAEGGKIDFSPLAELQSLKKLNLSDIRLKDLHGFPALPRLETLDISDNKLLNLDDLPELPGLHTLNAGNNTIVDIRGVSNLKNLNSLYLEGNKIEDIKPLAALSELFFLDVEHNEISLIDYLSKLARLQTLKLNYNKIELIPNSFFDNLPALKELSIAENPITNIPSDILRGGLEAITDYFSSLKKGSILNDEVKLILIGNSTAGKSTLVRFLKEYIYEEGQNSTHGIALNNWLIDTAGQALKVNIWDFGGQEYYHATHGLFLDDNALYLLVWEVDTNRQGLSETLIYLSGEMRSVQLEHFPYSYWLENIRYYAAESSILMLQTKTDLFVPEAVGKKYFEQPYFVKSPAYHLSVFNAHKFKDSSDEPHWLEFKTFELKLIETLQTEASKYLLGARWIEIRDKIRSFPQSINWMSFTEFEEFCRGIDPAIELKGLMAYLSGATSTILYYGQNPVLKDIVFLNPQWVTGTIYDILSYDIQEKQGGEFTRIHAGKVLNEKGMGAITDKFLELMKANQFELIFEKPDKPDTYIAPQYLPETYIDLRGLQKLFPKSFIRFTLYFPGYLPKSVFIRLMVRYGNLAEDVYWKYGIVIDKADTRIIAECLFTDQKIRITIENTPKAHDIGNKLFQELWHLGDLKPELEVSLNETDFVKTGKLTSQLEKSRNPEIESEQGNWLPVADFAYLFRKKEQIPAPLPPSANPEIFFSYAWGSPEDLQNYTTA